MKLFRACFRAIRAPLRHSRGERGLTLVELMAAMALAGVLLTIMFRVFVDQSQSFIENRLTSEMQQELRWAMQFISDRVKLSGNGVPPTCGWPVIENIDGVDGAPDSLSILGSFKSLVITTTQTMGNEGSQVKVDNSDGIEVGDLCVISDGTWQEVFMVTNINSLHLWHDKAEPWNDDNKLDHRYKENSSVTVVTYYNFFVEELEDGTKNLMVQTQAYEPQIIIGDVEDFQVRFKMANGDWINDPYPEEIIDIRMIELTINSRSPEPIRGYIDPIYNDPYKRIELKSVVIPKNITIL